MRTLETDYLVVGAGAMGMAFTDAVIDHADLRKFAFRAGERERLQKEEEERAREKVRVKLEQDRRERRRKLGLPPDLSEEEKAAEAQKAEERAAAEAKKKLPVKPAVGE